MDYDDNVYTKPVSHDMNMIKGGMGNTQHQEKAFKSVYVQGVPKNVNNFNDL